MANNFEFILIWIFRQQTQRWIWSFTLLHSYLYQKCVAVKVPSELMIYSNYTYIINISLQLRVTMVIENRFGPSFNAQQAGNIQSGNSIFTVFPSIENISQKYCNYPWEIPKIIQKRQLLTWIARYLSSLVWKSKLWNTRCFDIWMFQTDQFVGVTFKIKTNNKSRKSSSYRCKGFLCLEYSFQIIKQYLHKFH